MNHSEQDRQYHDGIADQYDRVVVEPRAYAIGLLFEGLLDLLGSGEKLLDLGCGTGHMLLRCAGAFRTAVGVDHSDGMLRAARSSLDRRGLRNVVLVRRDLFAFCSEVISSFDAITCVGVLHHLTDDGRGRLLDAMHALCAAHGRVLLAEPLRSSPEPQAVIEWNRSVGGGDRRRFDGSLPPDPNEAPLDEGAWRADIKRAGFEVIAETRIWDVSASRELPPMQERDALRRLVAQNPGGNVMALLLGRS
jgi:SAM-dependent methyltransferase